MSSCQESSVPKSIYQSSYELPTPGSQPTMSLLDLVSPQALMASAPPPSSPRPAAPRTQVPSLAGAIQDVLAMLDDDDLFTDADFGAGRAMTEEPFFMAGNPMGPAPQ